MPKKISLQQFLMRSGLFEKAFEAEKAIRDGKVAVSRERITNPKHFVNPKTALIFFNGKRLIPLKKLYFALNKPKGVVSQKSKEEQNVYDLLEGIDLTAEQKASLFAVGRLDKDTEGLIIITNDGQLSHILLSPKSKVPKTYEAISLNPLKPKDIQMLEFGVAIDDEGGQYMTQPAIIEKRGDRTFLITITEGKKNQIRLMLKSIGNEIVHLRRISIGNLSLEPLKIGEIRQMRRDELLREIIGHSRE